MMMLAINIRTLSLVYFCLIFIAIFVGDPVKAKRNKKHKNITRNTGNITESSSSSSLDPCETDLKDKFDSDVARLMTIGGHGRRWPENRDEHESYCAESQRLNEHVDAYKTRCAAGTSKQFTSVILYSIRRVIKQYCRNIATSRASLKKRFEKMYQVSACANKLAENMEQCRLDYVDSLFGTLKVSKENIKKQIPYTCCNYYQFLKCSEEVFKSTPNCSGESDMFQEFIRSIFDDIINLACGDYVENGDKCDQLPPLLKPGPDHVRPKSVLVPLIEIWDQHQHRRNES